MIFKVFAQTASVFAVTHLFLVSSFGRQIQFDDSERPVMSAVPLSEAPVLDGIVSGDPAWHNVRAVSTFWQQAPNDGEPASERTEIRIAYTEDIFYVSAILFDRNPEAIIVSDSRRDASLDDTDSFRFILDTFRDSQNGFVFGTNPAGIEYDAQVTNAGQGGFGGGGGSFGGGRQRRGSGGGLNLNWDGSWEVATVINESGWSVEFAIPFRTLRFPSSDVQTWGINFQRNIRRRNEKSFWAQLPRQYNLTRVSLAGEINGIRVPKSRNLKVMPYALSSTQRDYEIGDSKLENTGEFGIDVKYSLTSSLTLDATYNTDFAQVEVDEQQVNLDRFSLFFPEKRPFFLENAGLFSVGERGEVELFFSRRIGIDENGGSVPIVGGGRLSGQVGDFKVGLLEMQTESVGDELQANNFGVARVVKEFPNRSSLGVLFTNRQGTGSFADENDYNRLFAVDGQLGVGENGHVKGFFAQSSSPDIGDNEFAFRADGSYSTETVTLSGGYTEVASNFNPEIGFLRRSNYRKASLSIFSRFRPENFLSLQEIRPHTNMWGYWGRDDAFQETGYVHIDTHWEFKNAWEIHTGYNLRREGVREEFEISDGVVVPADTYDHTEIQIVAQTDQSDPINLSVRTTIGGFFGGDKVSVSPSLKVRYDEALSTEFSLSHNDVNIPGGAFTTNLFRVRVNYSFSTRIFVQLLGQYNDSDDIWSANVRFGWLRAANTGLFVVYNQTNMIDGWPGPVLNKGLTVKYTHLFDVFE